MAVDGGEAGALPCLLDLPAPPALAGACSFLCGWPAFDCEEESTIPISVS